MALSFGSWVVSASHAGEPAESCGIGGGDRSDLRLSGGPNETAGMSVDLFNRMRTSSNQLIAKNIHFKAGGCRNLVSVNMI